MTTDEDVINADNKVVTAHNNADMVRKEAINEHQQIADNEEEKAEELKNN